ncbi:SAM-dependent methyltransferase [Nocardia sp. NBC_01009]|uniref:SAM-dependent methyltransferase n=1 Tax=Nocardia sp. NBC_01009 TaxID=2975996 RepID=UPI0038666405|nr:methyltransferase domain-containing protein [Nocardia sp. NBC_01009]
MTETSESNATQEFWEEFYRDRDQVWSGNPNPLLVREVADLTPGSALDLGCGEGGDAIWLAGHGWRVTAVDVSATALRRAAGHAQDAGVGDRIVWAEHDLAQSFPDGSFDLVTAQFFHSPVAQADERTDVLRRAAAAVSPGGVLLIAGHAGWPSFVHEHDAPFDVHFPTIPEVIDGLGLDTTAWQVETTDEVQREVTGPDGQSGHRADTVVRIRRLR